MMTSIPQLLMSRAKAEKLLQNQIKRGETAQAGDIFSDEGLKEILDRIDAWEEQTKDLLKSMFDSSELADRFTRAASEYKKGTNLKQNISYVGGRVTYKNYCLDEIRKDLSLYEEVEEEKSVKDSPEKYIKVLDKISTRFHIIVRQLRERYNDRETLDVKDEYDVQDLLHAILRLFFDDIRAEDVSPQYAGGSARVDFLVKQEQIVIETKKPEQVSKLNN